MTAPEPSPSVAALRARFGDAVVRHRVSCGDTIVWVRGERAHEILAWLRDDPGQAFDYLTEVVYQLRALARRADLRVKIELDKAAPLEVESVCDLWSGANWLEREVFDMFGVAFRGHPDLRRILMWDTYAEGYPLRKDFPLRGHFSRSEQTRQALAANPESHYSLEELSLAETYHEIPEDMRERLQRGEHGEVA
jgi:NADH-quinone oxidoreductase subunit C